MIMPEKASNRWSQVLSRLAAQVGPQSFDTWFGPIAFESCADSVLRLTAPNEQFRKWFLDCYGDLLRRTAAEVLGVQEISVIVDTRCSETQTTAPPPLPVVQAAALERSAPGSNWLIERLWMAGAVGILGAPPKLGKSWLAMEMAVSVASGVACLGTFPVAATGPVLLYAAEESTAAVRARLESLCTHRKADLETLKLWVITADLLRLDHADDQHKLEATVASYEPRLLVLDPLIRLHNLDENASGPMAALLGFFRSLQRKTGTAIAIVHHTRKGPVVGGPGYSLRGSSELYAWVDCFLHLQRRRGQLTLTAEHRSAPSFGPVPLQLVNQDGVNPHLEVVTDAPSTQPAAGSTYDHGDVLARRALDLLSTASGPITTADLRRHLGVRNQRVVELLHELVSRGKVQRTERGYVAPRC